MMSLSGDADISVQTANEKLFMKLKTEADTGGYFLNPDTEFVMDLMDGLNKNLKRYGYISCPCRLASGKKEEDLDIICACDYRDDDLSEYNSCYCALYVSKEAFEGKIKINPIPERRPASRSALYNIKDAPVIDQTAKSSEDPGNTPLTAGATLPGAYIKTPYPVWRCRVCGYLCARDHPPGVCPICKAASERFEKFLFVTPQSSDNSALPAP